MTDRDEVKATLHKALLAVEEKLLTRPEGLNDNGICENVNYWLDDNIADIDLDAAAYDTLIRLMKQWPEYSGYPKYPVPHPQFHANDAYDKFPLWNLETEYGKARYRLLKWLIKETEQ